MKKIGLKLLLLITAFSLSGCGWFKKEETDLKTEPPPISDEGSDLPKDNLEEAIKIVEALEKLGLE